MKIIIIYNERYFKTLINIYEKHTNDVIKLKKYLFINLDLDLIFFKTQIF